MKKKKGRRLSRAHRQKISRGLRPKRWSKARRAAERLRQIQRTELRQHVEDAIQDGRRIRGGPNSKYRGRFVSARYARRYPHLVLIDEGQEDWELTIRYSKKGKALGVTMRITAPRGTPREVIAIVARRAGLPGGTVERGFQVRDIEWQKPLKDYRYGDDIETGLQVSGWTGLLAQGTMRLERVKE